MNRNYSSGGSYRTDDSTVFDKNMRAGGDRGGGYRGPSSNRSKIWLVAAGAIVGFVVGFFLLRALMPGEGDQTRPDGTINGHEWVDLGLSVKWATCNIGASSPSDYGDYYAWGETWTKSEYREDNSVTHGKTMDDISGDVRYDAARANWGGSWRLPTASEILELVNKCTWIWTRQGGHKGYRVTGPNGKSIFLPAAGFRYGVSFRNRKRTGCYMCSTPNDGDTIYVSYLSFHNSYFDLGWGLFRSDGHSVRPVSD